MPLNKTFGKTLHKADDIDKKYPEDTPFEIEYTGVAIVKASSVMEAVEKFHNSDIEEKAELVAVSLHEHNHVHDSDTVIPLGPPTSSSGLMN